MQGSVSVAQRHHGDHHGRAVRVADDANAVDVRRLPVGFVDDPVRVVDGFGGPLRLDVDGVGIALGAGANVVGRVVVPVDPLGRV